MRVSSKPRKTSRVSSFGRRRVAFVLLTLVLGITDSLSQDATYTDPTYGFSIRHPQSWSVRPLDGDSLKYRVMDPERRLACRVFVQSYDDFGIVDALMADVIQPMLETSWKEQEWRDMYEGVHADISFHDETVGHLPDGWPAPTITISYKLQDADGTAYVHQRELITMRNGYVYIVNCYSLSADKTKAEEKWRASEAMANEVLSSFKVPAR
jgi:hypothetical protein